MHCSLLSTWPHTHSELHLMSSYCLFSVPFDPPINCPMSKASYSKIFKRQNLIGSISHWTPYCPDYRPAFRLAILASDFYLVMAQLEEPAVSARDPRWGSLRRELSMRLRSLDSFRPTRRHVWAHIPASLLPTWPWQTSLSDTQAFVAHSL